MPSKKSKNKSQNSVDKPEYVSELETFPLSDSDPEPVVELEPEPEPVVELEPEPVVELELEPEPVVELELEPEPEPEPVVELEPEPEPKIKLVINDIPEVMPVFFPPSLKQNKVPVSKVSAVNAPVRMGKRMQRTPMMGMRFK